MKKSKLPKISEILHLAADKFLAVNAYEFQNNCQKKQRFSCTAIRSAITSLKGLTLSEQDHLSKQISIGLTNMGVNTRSNVSFKRQEKNKFSTVVDEHSEKVAQSQGDRYFWLKWAALMAEEQGE